MIPRTSAAVSRHALSRFFIEDSLLGSNRQYRFAQVKGPQVHTWQDRRSCSHGPTFQFVIAAVWTVRTAVKKPPNTSRGMNQLRGSRADWILLARVPRATKY